jgi:hypothetical protein
MSLVFRSNLYVNAHLSLLVVRVLGQAEIIIKILLSRLKNDWIFSRVRSGLAGCGHPTANLVSCGAVLIEIFCVNRQLSVHAFDYGFESHVSHWGNGLLVTLVAYTDISCKNNKLIHIPE